MILGCMFAGKSTELLRRVRKHEIAGKTILNVKFSADHRYSGKSEIVTHHGQKRSATAVLELFHLGNVWHSFDVIGIDEPEQDTFAPVDDDNSRSDTLDNSAGKPPADANEKS